MVRWAHAWSAETCIRKISGARKRCAEEPSRPVASPQAGAKTSGELFLERREAPWKLNDKVRRHGRRDLATLILIRASGTWGRLGEGRA